VEFIIGTGTMSVRDCLHLALQSVIRLDQSAGADVTVGCSYVQIGKIFSMDAVVKDSTGQVITRAYEQGESLDDLVPAVSRLAQKLTAAVSARYPSPAATASLPTAAVAAPATGAVATAAAAPSSIVKTAPTGDIIRPQQITRQSASGWQSPRIEGKLIGLAPGLVRPSGEREVYVVGEEVLKLYLVGTDFKLLDQQRFPEKYQVLGVDTADLDRDGTQEVYVTLLYGEDLVSQVWEQKNGRLVRLADRLPYYFRALDVSGGERKIIAQQNSVETDFYGDILEIVKQGNRFDAKPFAKLPRGNVYTFNQFRDASGALHTVILNEDGLLVVYGPTGDELWRGSDKYGGTTVHYERDNSQMQRFTGVKNRSVFLQQRITLSPANEIIVPQNTGTFVAGNTRVYNKSAVVAFEWTGSVLEERWRTRTVEMYQPDYFYDATRKELVLLQQAKIEGPLEKGASIISIKKVE